MLTKKFILDTVDRAARTFVYAYMGAWIALGPEFDTLFTFDNVKAGVVGLALSVAGAVGLKRAQPKSDTSALVPDHPHER